MNVYLKLQANPGANVEDVAAEAIEVSKRLGGISVYVRFNGIDCYMTDQDVASNIKDWFLAACRMGWDHIDKARMVPLGILTTIIATDEQGKYLVADPKAKYPALAPPPGPPNPPKPPWHNPVG